MSPVSCGAHMLKAHKGIQRPQQAYLFLTVHARKAHKQSSQRNPSTSVSLPLGAGGIAGCGLGRGDGMCEGRGGGGGGGCSRRGCPWGENGEEEGDDGHEGG
eukprot:scaffold77448_cov16-Tisochrysis_lutea.AAC.1